MTIKKWGEHPGPKEYMEHYLIQYYDMMIYEIQMFSVVQLRYVS